LQTAKTVERNFFENTSRTFPKRQETKKKNGFSQNVKCKHNLLLDIPERSHENRSCNVLPVDIPSVVREFYAEKPPSTTINRLLRSLQGHSVSILRTRSKHPLQFSWNFTQIVITPC